jgi:hypothetical protein
VIGGLRVAERNVAALHFNKLYFNERSSWCFRLALFLMHTAWFPGWFGEL